MRLIQVAMVTERLAPVVDALCRKLSLEVAFNDPGVAVFGLENAVIPVGDTFLEVLAPVKPGTTAGRYLERRGGDTGYMVILHGAELAPARERLRKIGVRIAWEGKFEPSAKEGFGAAWQGIHLHPADTGGALLSLDHTDPPDAWPAAGPRWRDHVNTGVVRELVAAELQSDDPDRLAARWSQVLGLPVANGEIALDRGRLRFVKARDGRGEGLGGIDLRAADRERAGETFEVCGMRVRLC
jgi:hypothetical protein